MLNSKHNISFTSTEFFHTDAFIPMFILTPLTRPTSVDNHVAAVIYRTPPPTPSQRRWEKNRLFAALPPKNLALRWREGTQAGGGG